MTTDDVGDCSVYGEATPRSLGLQWVEVGHGICHQGQWPRELGPPAGDLDTHVSMKCLRSVCSECFV